MFLLGIRGWFLKDQTDSHSELGPRCGHCLEEYIVQCCSVESLLRRGQQVWIADSMFAPVLLNSVPEVVRNGISYLSPAVTTSTNVWCVTEWIRPSDRNSVWCRGTSAHAATKWLFFCNPAVHNVHWEAVKGEGLI